jgi:hypothetical protein
MVDTAAERNAETGSRVQLDWKSVAGLLAGAGSARGSSKWIGLRVIDTVFLNASCKVERWIFTAKTGQAAAKKRGEGLDKLAERFSRFALANPHNQEQLVALITLANATEKRVAVTAAALNTLLLAPAGANATLAGSWLQCFLRPRGGVNTYLSSVWHGPGTAVTVSQVMPLYTAHSVGQSADTSVPAASSAADLASLQTDVAKHTEELAAFLSSAVSPGHALQSFAAEFILDDNSDLWLSAVQNTVTLRTEPTAAAQPIAASNSTADSTVAAASASSATGAKASASSDSSSSSSSSVVPIIQRSAGVYVSNVHAGSLRGLSAWRETAPGVWALSAERYSSASARSNSSGSASTTAVPTAWSDESPAVTATAVTASNSSSSSSFAELSAQRWQVTARSVLLALQLEPFLKGEAAAAVGSSSSATAAEIAKVWRDKDRAAQLELAAANPQVSHSLLLHLASKTCLAASCLTVQLLHVVMPPYACDGQANLERRIFRADELICIAAMARLNIASTFDVAGVLRTDYSVWQLLQHSAEA